MTRVLIALVLAACGSSSTPSDPPDGPGTDAPSNPATLPTWQLEDVQPQSPRVGQTYGLDTFSGKIVVVTLLEGF